MTSHYVVWVLVADISCLRTLCRSSNMIFSLLLVSSYFAMSLLSLLRPLCCNEKIERKGSENEKKNSNVFQKLELMRQFSINLLIHVLLIVHLSDIKNSKNYHVIEIHEIWLFVELLKLPLLTIFVFRNFGSWKKIIFDILLDQQMPYDLWWTMICL